MSGSLHVEPDPEALARYTAEWLIRRLSTGSGAVRIALSGGSTPKRLYELLADADHRDRVSWDRLELFWGDERFVPPDHPDSNYGMTSRALLSHVPLQPAKVHRAPTEGDPDEAAWHYQRELAASYGRDVLDAARPLFDVVFLGLGENGHTASLFPGSVVLDERLRWVVPITDGGVPQPRLTLTYPAIASSRAVVFLVAGGGKTEMLARVRAGDRTLPAARVTSDGELLWFADAAAAGQ